jgi:HD-GYP domain-containing protein (c-di-GMP phosphodiesterase class II)
MNTTVQNNFFTCPEFLKMERTIIDDFVDCTRECCIEVDSCVKALNRHGGPEYIHRMFRSMHSLKGNCQMVGLAPFNALMHRIEEIFSVLRAHPEQYFPELGEFLLLATDEIEQLLTELINEGVGDELRRARLASVCEELQKRCVSGLRAEYFRDAIIALGGRVSSKAEAAKTERTVQALPADLVLMQNWASYIDNLSIFRKNRSTQTVQLAEALNQAVGTVVDPDQLQAAVLMHDLGMAFIPHSIFNKEGHLSREEQRIIQEHVLIGYQMLQRFSGWDEAAIMVLDHHEFYDGSGYPNRLSGEQIHPGGRMLAIIDTFCSITTERSDRSYKKSLLSAISEINANIEVQFDPKLVNAFNDVVRGLMMKQN